ncbi:MAG: TIGR01212 family radical SAM protein [candidate division KSB1 bacterium]|nr:TIGR01212 family radical SAM protein [candidate division KSB1 bacterium]
MSKRYNSFNDYLQRKFNTKVWKVCLDAALPCPNKIGDGRGCLFCRNESFAPQYGSSLTIPEQLALGIAKAKQRGISRYIAYFQAGTNTFAPAEKLRPLFFSALEFEGVIGLSIATRPDCIRPDIIDLLKELAQKTRLWIEIGLQSANEDILDKIHRGHTVEDYVKAVDALRSVDARICTHLIFGLPEETMQDVHECARLIARVGSHEAKIHPLLILKETPVGEMYQNGLLQEIALEEYAAKVCDFLERIPPDVVIQRLTAEAPREMLLAPLWTLQKSNVLNAIEKEFAKRGSRQSALYR